MLTNPQSVAAEDTAEISGWRFAARKACISCADELDNIVNELARRAELAGGTSPPLHTMPEMCFGRNSLTVSLGATPLLEFRAVDALACVEVGAESPRWRRIKVAAAAKWGISSSSSSSPLVAAEVAADPAKCTATPTISTNTINTNSISINSISGNSIINSNGNGNGNRNGDEEDATDESKPTTIDTSRPFDWTYYAPYGGTLNERACMVVPATSISTSTSTTTKPGAGYRIPYELLMNQQEPISFYSDIILFEDELGDNGVSKYSVKIRVMGHGFYILARHYLRVDHVMFATHDTRMYHAFGTRHIVRERTASSAEHAAVAAACAASNQGGASRALDEDWVAAAIAPTSAAASGGAPLGESETRIDVIKITL